MPKGRKRTATVGEVNTDPYIHRDATNAMRPEVGTQARFKSRKPPATYRYDSSLSPALDYDGQNAAREQGEALIAKILDAPDLAHAKAAASQLRALSKPFLNWAGKAERLSFDVPTLPLFVHERLSTRAIIETLKRHRKDKGLEQLSFMEMFNDPQRSIADQILRAYEYRDKWVNRMVLGDSLVVMNSLLRYEGLGGQVQMIYIDPPYGVKFGSNFQPFVRKRDVKHGDDDDLTREPEMVKAYRDTWELGLHSYLTYLRDRLLLARDLLTPSGSVFVQISDDNVHHVREVMDEVFGEQNFCALIGFAKTSGATAELLPSTSDYLLWYARDRERCKYTQLYLPKELQGDGAAGYDWVELSDGSRRRMSPEESDRPGSLPDGARVFKASDVTSQRQGRPSGPGTAMHFPIELEGRLFSPRGQRGWTTTQQGMERLRDQRRLHLVGDTPSYVRYFDDFPFFPASNTWADTGIAGYASEKLYVVQTNAKVIQRCVQMTTSPGDLVLDPTCGSGTTAHVAEQLGRRWITIDTSRVPLALARQRLLTATFPWYELKDDVRGPASGFVYKRKQNGKGEEVGGIVPHVTLKSIATNEPATEEVLVDRPEVNNAITRVSGPFVVEATIPTPMETEEDATVDEPYGDFVARMIEVLRQSPVLMAGGGKTATLKNVRPPAKSLSLSAEAANGDGKPVAIVFGPQSAAVSERLVDSALREAHLKGYAHLYVIGFAINPNARQLIDNAEALSDIPSTYVQATPDLMMGDLLKNMRSSQIFSVCGLPDVTLSKFKNEDGETRYRVKLLGFDIFDPVTMEVDHRSGEDVPAWLLDSDYNGNVFRVTQAFFPRTGAWESLKKALRATHDESVWDHLAVVESEPFAEGDTKQIAVKVIDDRGNELLVVKDLLEAR